MIRKLLYLLLRIVPGYIICRLCECVTSKPKKLTRKSREYMIKRTWQDPPGIIRRVLWNTFNALENDTRFIMKWYKGIRLYCYQNDRMNYYLFCSEAFEDNEFILLQDTLKEGMTFIDVGANHGCYSLFASKLVGNRGQVVAIEPAHSMYKKLRDNIKLNHSVNILPMRIACSDTKGTATLKIADGGNVGHNTLGEFGYKWVRTKSIEKVTLDKLDNILKDIVNKVDIIKIDVEGHEMHVLRGAETTLRRFRPVIMVEIQDISLVPQGSTGRDILRFLRNLEYDLYCFSHKTGRLIPLLKETIPAVSENICAFPREKRIAL